MPFVVSLDGVYMGIDGQFVLEPNSDRFAIDVMQWPSRQAADVWIRQNIPPWQQNEIYICQYTPDVVAISQQTMFVATMLSVLIVIILYAILRSSS